MLTEETVIDQIMINEDGAVFVRHRNRILRDGLEIASSYHRTSYEPAADVSAADAKVQTVAAVVWTKTVKDAWQAKRDAIDAETQRKVR